SAAPTRASSQRPAMVRSEARYLACRVSKRYLTDLARLTGRCRALVRHRHAAQRVDGSVPDCAPSADRGKRTGRLVILGTHGLDPFEFLNGNHGRDRSTATLDVVVLRAVTYLIHDRRELGPGLCQRDPFAIAPSVF